MKNRLIGMTPDELKRVAEETGLPGFAAGQIARWLYVRKVRRIGEITDVL